MITGINHLTLSIRDLDKSLKFYLEILECKLIAKWNQGAYLLAGAQWICLTLDSHTRTTPLPEYTHVAFGVTQENFTTVASRIINSGAIIWKENTSEGDSLYFLDPNGHKLEIHSGTLQKRILTCKKTPYAGMEFFANDF